MADPAPAAAAADASSARTASSPQREPEDIHGSAHRYVGGWTAHEASDDGRACSLRSLGALITLNALKTDIALESYIALESLRSDIPLETKIALGTNISLCPLKSCDSWRTGIALWTVVP